MASGTETTDTDTDSDASDMWNSDSFLVLIREDVTADTWSSQLDFFRACTGTEKRCWLCTELASWNQAMHMLGFELVELRPGKLRLQSGQHGYGVTDWDRATDAAKASFLVSWLLQHHRCIDELKVAYGIYLGKRKQARPFPISLRTAAGSTLRGLDLQQSASACLDTIAGVSRDCYELVDLDAVGELERLKLDFACIKPEFDAELAKLLRRNAGSIKRLEIKTLMLPRKVNHALRYLFSCESLTISSYADECDCLQSVTSVARLLHSSTALKELSTPPMASRRHVSAIAEELETNTSLTKLALRMAEKRWSPQPVFTALLANTVLKELRVTGCRVSGECGEALALLVLKNTGLRLLYVGDVDVSESCLVQLAAALEMNTTLETLHLSSNVLPTNGIAELCKVLRINKTLKKLLCTGFQCPQEFRALLARQLIEDDCYGRVQLPWTESDLPGLTAALTSSLAVIEELSLRDICHFSMAGLRQLFGALASSKCVRTLGVCTKGDPGEKGTALCEMLQVNRSIQCLVLAIGCAAYRFVEEISHTLAENASITNIVLSIGNTRAHDAATALSYLLAHNKTATKFFLHAPDGLCHGFVEEVSRGMLQNKTIVKFGSTHNLFGKATHFAFFEAVRGNRGALNRAVDFVVSPSLDRQCAEGFELFNGRPCLLKLLKKVTGQVEPEALLAIATAERYLHDNYLHITGIVRHSVKCHPAEGTQVDALNKDCWLAIVRHLKITDVLT